MDSLYRQGFKTCRIVAESIDELFETIRRKVMPQTNYNNGGFIGFNAVYHITHYKVRVSVLFNGILSDKLIPYCELEAEVGLNQLTFRVKDLDLYLSQCAKRRRKVKKLSCIEQQR